MATVNGTVSITQLSDLEMAKVFEAKATAGSKFTVQLPVPPGQSLVSPTQANLYWTGLEGLEAAHQALKSILAAKQ